MKLMIKPGGILLCALFCLAITSCAAKEPSDNLITGIEPRSLPTIPESISGSNAGNRINIGDSASINIDINAAVNTEPEPLSMEKDIGISVNGQWFPIWQDSAGLLQALGGNYTLTAAPSCVFDGEDKEFAFDGCYVFTNPDVGSGGERDIWYSIFFESDTYSTSRGIHVGNSLDEITAVYGDRYYWEGENILTYSLSGIEGDISSPCIQITLLEGLITAIEIYYPTNVS